MRITKAPNLSAESVLFVGDTHADTGWLKYVVLPQAVKLGVTTIIQVGDFGYWPDAPKFRHVASNARKKFGVDVWFIDGNHEHFPSLQRDVRAVQITTGVAEGSREPVELAPGFLFLPRGSRAVVAGRSVAFVGGAASIDRRDRVEGKTWFCDERVSDDDLRAVKAGGHADVLVTHDAPSGWDIKEFSENIKYSESWEQEMPACDAHRERLREVLEFVTPNTLIHGHYHHAYLRRSFEKWGELYTYGLDRNTKKRWGVTMRDVDGELQVEWVGAN